MEQKQKLFTELRWIYTTTKEYPCVIRIRIRMRDLVDPDVFRNAVDTTMERYPYFCVELQKTDGQYCFVQNHRPVVITNSPHGVELNSKDSNYHMIAFSWWDNWIMLEVFHGMTDGAGAYEVIGTLLHYYCSERYNIALSEEGVRLLGDDIPAEEWQIPWQTGRTCPYKLYPDSKDVIRVSLCVNQRDALHAPLAHQSLVGGAFLEYGEQMRDLPLNEQAPIYRKMVSEQTQEDAVLMGVASQSGIAHMILSKESDQERIELANAICSVAQSVTTVTVSYVGKANFKGAEQYVRDFRLWTSSASRQWGYSPLPDVIAWHPHH